MSPKLVGHIAVLRLGRRRLGGELVEGLLGDVGVDEGQVLLQVEDGVANRPLAQVLRREGRNVEDTPLEEGE